MTRGHAQITRKSDNQDKVCPRKAKKKRKKRKKKKKGRIKEEWQNKKRNDTKSRTADNEPQSLKP